MTIAFFEKMRLMASGISCRIFNFSFQKSSASYYTTVTSSAGKPFMIRVVTTMSKYLSIINMNNLLKPYSSILHEMQLS
jgi:hypothetical protein